LDDKVALSAGDQDLIGADMAAEAGIGPILHLRGVDGRVVRLRALVVCREAEPAPTLSTEAGGTIAGRTLLRFAGLHALAYDFELPLATETGYSLDGVRYPLRMDFIGDLRLAFVSCNGQESDDRKRDIAERDALWHRLAQQHAEDPFHLQLQGGDQIYADEVVNLHALERHRPVAAWRRHRSADAGPLREAMRKELFLRYLELYRHPDMAWLMARVPTLAMWDDHDICDGWGSLPAERMDSPLGRAIFEVAREFFLLFQCAVGADEALPDLFLDPEGISLGWHLKLPGCHLVAPDLRSERRRDRVMGERGWQGLRHALAAADAGRVLLLSCVPALGPRLSWVEAVMHLTQRMEKYEDDLRDQWQSRAHREEWRDFLALLVEVHSRGATPVTVLSGEIHLATRGTLASAAGPLHQLVASGITHPAPAKAYARGLGLLARFGASPLPGYPIRLHPLPGRRAIYTAERNYLVLKRRGGQWLAHWELEHGGATLPLAL